jgi:hypothetical protein
VLCFLTVGLVARRAGGWWPTTWGWAALALLFVAAATVILLPRLELGRLDVELLGGIAALTAWIGLSTIWSESRPETVLELERAIVYVAGTLALLAVARRRSLAGILAGLLAAAVALCVHALATRFAPDRVHWAGSSLGFRLDGVLAYPNALAIVAVLGLLLALGLAADARAAAARAAAAAATVPLALALDLATSRGAWLALVAGLAAALALPPRRRALVRALVPLAAVAALGIWLLSRSRTLTRWDDPAAAAHDGHLMAVAGLALCVAAALTALRPTRATAVAAVAACAVAVAVAPASVARLAAGPGVPLVPGAPAPGATPAGTLFSTTSNSRTEYWRVALHDARHHPVLGSGAGTFVRQWYAHRRIRVAVQDAHSLYLETLAELGVVGLALLLFTLAVPVRAALRARGERYVAATFGAFVAFAAHSAVDWDWELPAVTLAGLFCGAALVVAARPPGAALALDGRWRGAILVPVLGLLAFSFVGLVGNRADENALAAAYRGDWKTTQTEASHARGWAPWSADAIVLLADAAHGRGDRAGAVRLLREAARKDPHDYVVWNRIAAVTTGAERRRAHAEAMRLNPLG